MSKERTIMEWQSIGYPGVTHATSNPCDCCGRHVWTMDGYAIHTGCIRNHYKHAKGKNTSRCKAFKYADKG
jgi:hypothetical protein